MRSDRKPVSSKQVVRIGPDVRRALNAPAWAGMEPWYSPVTQVVPHLPVVLIPKGRRAEGFQEALSAAEALVRFWAHLIDRAMSGQRPDRAVVRSELAKVIVALDGGSVTFTPAHRVDLIVRSIRLANDGLNCPDWHHTQWAIELLALTRKGIALNNGNAAKWREIERMLQQTAVPDAQRMAALLHSIAHEMDHGHVVVTPHRHTAMFIKGVRVARVHLQAA